jgi:hypothetical protein
MASYLTPAGLAAIAQAESGGRNIPQGLVPYPSVSSASGYYQMINPTFQTGATNAGLDPSLYGGIAMNAPADVQALAAGNVDVSNWAKWSAADAAVLNQPGMTSPNSLTAADITGGNIPGLTDTSGITSAQNTANPIGADFNFVPTTDTSTAGATPNDFGSSTTPSDVQSALNPATTFAPTLADAAANTPLAGLAGANVPGNSTAPDWFDKILTNLQAFFIRWGLVMLAMILIGVAAWAMMHKAGIVAIGPQQAAAKARAWA